MKVGDKVRVKSDLKVGDAYSDAEVIDEMVKYFGKEASIIEVLYVDDTYGIDIDNNEFAWTNEMLDLIESV